MESATLSRTVSSSKRLTIWKLRAMPALMRPCTDWLVTSAPRKKICPLSGWMRPLIRFTRLVFPAPLAPINARTSPSPMVKSTLSTAWVSPKYLVSFSVWRRFTGRAAFWRAPRAAGRCPDPGGQDHHKDHQDDAEQRLPVDRETHCRGLQVVEDHGAHDGPGEVAEAAEHGHEDDLAREGPVEDVRRGKPVERDPERPGDPGEDAGDEEGD